MGKPTGFLEYDREVPQYKSPAERIKDYAEFYLEFSSKKPKHKLLDVWNAVYHFVIMVVLWEILYLTLMMLCTTKTGNKHTKY